ncbi:MAG: CDP-alcohol phosphatidyltransferase family protein, partial [Clostridia bacterium]|nr:CDP-alcohol phosphatidyltransferase family protein [Clostridia bacterium]
MKNKAWLPNSVTLINLILGFYAIILIIREQFVVAAFLIFLGMILDGVDGRLARKIAV